MAVRPDYLHVYLVPGQQISIGCASLYTASYSSSDSNVVAVSPTGLATAGISEGFATITIAEAGKTATAYVWVRTDSHIPHFSGSGTIMDRYVPGQSLFFIAPFFMDAADPGSDANRLLAVQQAGINTVSEGFYRNPRDTTTPYVNWKWFYDNYIAPDWKFARDHGLHILATGDEVCRNIGGEAWWTLNWPDGQQAVEYAFQGLAASGVAISVDMVDEGNLLWGPTPVPAGRVGKAGSFTSVSCSDQSCTVNWPSNPVGTGGYGGGLNFALSGSLTGNLNTPLGQLYTATSVTPNSFDFTLAGPVNGVFAADNDSNLEFLWWAGSYPGCPTEPLRSAGTQ